MPSLKSRTFFEGLPFDSRTISLSIPSMTSFFSIASRYLTSILSRYSSVAERWLKSKTGLSISLISSAVLTGTFCGKTNASLVPPGA